MKQFIWLGLGVGSTVGGALPILWGSSFFGFQSVILTAVGGLLGIWGAFKLGKAMGLS